jgi:flagellar protein FliO/FliZ
VAVGPHQRVVTVEVGPQDARIWLVLGVTQQSIGCLHTIAPRSGMERGGVETATATAPRL